MARYNFGGDLASFTILAPSGQSNVVKAQPNATGSVYAARTGGSALTDLLDHNGAAASTITSDADGFVRRFQGPSGYTDLWADFGGGSRFHLRTADNLGVRRLDGSGSAYTDGDILILGSHAYNTRHDSTADVGTGIVAGGGPAVYENVVGGNVANVNTATSNLTGAATLTGENGNWDFILGGYDNVVNGWACIVTGFHVKVGVNANHITVAGGSIHTVADSTAYGTIGGGTSNQVSGNNPTVAGGNANQATANGATVGGGQTNIASGSTSTIAGGTTNTANNSSATISGGSTNTASGNSASIGGGLTNSATATGATVPGGRDNVASGNYSLATGRQAVATESGMHAHAQAAFATAGDAQVNRWCLKKQTTDATASNLEADTGAPPVIPENTTWAFSALIVARRTDVDGDNAAFKVEGCFKRDAGSTAAMVGTPTVTALGASAGAATWTVTTGSFTAGTLRLIVTGEAAKTIRWVCELRASQASG